MKKVVLRFNFTDHRLAFRVRGTVYNALKKYDFNQNGLFEEQEIRQALLEILGQNENEVQYVVKNVYRYDVDRDNLITYEQFTNFCVEQHFGEMAIQRLHRKGYYAHGSSRIMSFEEFANTLNYCLGFLNCEGTIQEYQNLFMEVDKDDDGYISYEDYFIFLKEYFGSKSIASTDRTPSKPKPVTSPPKYTDGSRDGHQERFAKLIYTQLKVLVMDKDRNRNLVLYRQEVEDILSNIFQLNFSEQAQAIDTIMNYSPTVNYNDFMKNAVLLYVCELDPRKSIIDFNITQKDFIAHIERAAGFVSVRPPDHVLEACFRDIDLDGDGVISKNEYIWGVRRILQGYEFDVRGLANQRIF